MGQKCWVFEKVTSLTPIVFFWSLHLPQNNSVNAPGYYTLKTNYQKWLESNQNDMESLIKQSMDKK